MHRRLLLLLSQNPLDPAGGAARTLDSICRLVARHGYQVHALGSTASDMGDGRKPVDTPALLRNLGLNPEISHEDGARIFRFQRDRVDYTLLDTGTWRLHQPHPVHGPAFDRLYHAMLQSLRPEILLTFGATPLEQERQAQARRYGAAVVLSVQQHGYYDGRAFHGVDAVLTCSEFLRQCYIHRIGQDSVAIPSPLILNDVVADHHERAFVTYVNPSLEKGVYFFARLAEELAVHRPDIPLLVIEARGTAKTLVQAGLAGGFDLRRHSSLMISPGVPLPRDIYAPTRLLLAPSVWEEPWGRVAAEALLNGIPPIVSDRGGLAEACGDGGFVLDLPPDINPMMRIPPAPDVVKPWLELIQTLCDDQQAYQKASDRALRASTSFHPESLLPRYLDFFETAIARRKSSAPPA